MKIVALERFTLGTEHGSTGALIIRVKARGGLAGWGEVGFDGSPSRRMLAGFVGWLEAYEGALIGIDATNLSAVHRQLDGVDRSLRAACPPARAAIDMAVHDIIGWHRGCPVHTLLGGAYRTICETSTTLRHDTEEAAAGAARDHVAGGGQGVKVLFAEPATGGDGTSAIAANRQMLLAVLHAVGPEIAVDADAGQSFDSPGSVRRFFGDILAEGFHANLSVEQPLHRRDIEGHAVLRETLAIPLVLDESVVSAEAMMQIVHRAAADRVVINIGRVGGLDQARRIADICEAAAIGVTIDAMPQTRIGGAANCHLAATLRDPYPIAVEGGVQAPFDGGFRIADGRAFVSDAPGLGVDVDEGALQAPVVDG